MGLIAAAEVLENSKTCSQCGCLTLDLLRPPRSSSAPGTPLRNQFVAALLGAAGFRSRRGRLALQHHLGGGWCCLHQGWWAFSGRSLPRSRGGPNVHWGSCPGACCVRRVAAQPYGGWLARGETRQWAKRVITWQHARTTQMRMREARSWVPHVTSRQDSTYNIRAMSTVHRSPTINPH